MSRSRAPQKGIDIQQALEILAARSSCHHQHEAPPNARDLGQVIDLTGGLPTNHVQQVEKFQKQVKEERARRHSELQKKLQSMEVKELLHSILEAQQERVRTYREYDRYVRVGN